MSALGGGTLLASLVLAVPSPSPTSSVPDELEVTPGLVGFLATFAVAAAAVLLFLSLTRHLRRARSNAIERGLPVEEPRRHRFDGGASVQSPDLGPSPGTGGERAPGAGDRAPGDGATDGGRREGHDDGRGPTAP